MSEALTHHHATNLIIFIVFQPFFEQYGHGLESADIVILFLEEVPEKGILVPEAF